ncbi:MAG: RNA polymerase sigma factor [Planctomycetes bacterium]|nr:RNA polymerase sigma factor [Planctomycetota bacterium]
MNGDVELLSAAARGDRAAFERFVERHEFAVWRVIKTLEVDVARAEDALQETFLAAWRSAAGFRGDESARAWLLSIARHAVYRQHRKRSGEPAEMGSLVELGRAAGLGAEPTTDPMNTFEQRDEILRAFESLSAADREAIVLRDVAELSAEEAARIAGTSVPAHKSRLHRARLKFAAFVRGVDHVA